MPIVIGQKPAAGGGGGSGEGLTPAQETKLNSIQFAATANQTDAHLKDRSNHTGQQPISTVSGLQMLLDQLAESGMSDAELARLVAVEDTLPMKADLDGGKLALDQMPDIAAGRKITVADEAARLALDVWPDLTIAYQLDDGNAYAADAGSDLSVTGNWSLLGSGISSGVGSFNSRTGNVLPQAGDYTAEQIAESAAKQFVSATEKAEWTAKETVAGAQAKAAAAGQDAKDYADLTFIEQTQKGAADGVATLNESGELPESQLSLKTINGESIRGDGNLVIEGGGESNSGWTPVLAVVEDGSSNVLQVADYDGGTGDKPATGLYVGATGLVNDIADAVSIRGQKGDQGASGSTVVEIPAAFGVPYPTNETFDGRTVWACRVDLGLTAATGVNKSTVLPAAITSEWDESGSYSPRIDTSSAFAIRPDLSVYPLPYSHGGSLTVNSEILLIVSTGVVNSRVWHTGLNGNPHQCVIKYVKQVV